MKSASLSENPLLSNATGITGFELNSSLGDSFKNISVPFSGAATSLVDQV